MFKLKEQRHGRWDDGDRLIVAQLLAKAGYRIKICKERKTPGKPALVTYIEVEGDVPGDAE